MLMEESKINFDQTQTKVISNRLFCMIGLIFIAIIETEILMEIEKLQAK